jgi:hypothetical protein
MVMEGADKRGYGLSISAVAERYTDVAQQSTPFCAPDGAAAKAFAKLFFG